MTDPSIHSPGASNAADAYRPPARYPAPPPPAAIGGEEHSATMRMLLPVGRSAWAIVAGYLGLFAFIIFPAPLALVASILAFRDLKAHPEKHGRGRAAFGLIMGVIGTLILGFFGWAWATR